MILIVQNGLLGTYIQKYLDDEIDLVQIAKSNLDNINLDPYNLIIILGGHQCVSQIILFPELNKVISFMKKCVQMKKPIIGICLGCHLIAHMMECKIEKSFYMSRGYNTTISFDDKIYNNLFRCHSDYIVPNDKIEVLSTFDDKPYLIKASGMIGIQCHPDIPPECISRFINISVLKKTKDGNKIKDYDIIDKENRELMQKLLKYARSLYDIQ